MIVCSRLGIGVAICAIALMSSIFASIWQVVLLQLQLTGACDHAQAVNHMNVLTALLSEEHAAITVFNETNGKIAPILNNRMAQVEQRIWKLKQLDADISTDLLMFLGGLADHRSQACHIADNVMTGDVERCRGFYIQAIDIAIESMQSHTSSIDAADERAFAVQALLLVKLSKLIGDLRSSIGALSTKSMNSEGLNDDWPEFEARAFAFHNVPEAFQLFPPQTQQALSKINFEPAAIWVDWAYQVRNGTATGPVDLYALFQNFSSVVSPVMCVSAVLSEDIRGYYKEQRDSGAVFLAIVLAPALLSFFPLIIAFRTVLKRDQQEIATMKAHTALHRSTVQFLSHELRNPLSGLLGSLELLEEFDVEDLRREQRFQMMKDYLRAARSCAATVNEVIAGVLALDSVAAEQQVCDFH